VICYDLAGDSTKSQLIMGSKQKRNRFIQKASVLLLLLTWLNPGTASGASPVYPSRFSPSAPILEAHPVYLPFIMAVYPVVSWTFGVETFALGNGNNLDKIQDLHAAWVRSTLFDWNQIEPVRTDPPTYAWDKVNATGLELAAEHGFKVIAIVKNTPSWAQKFPGVICGPIHPNYLDAFVQFVRAIVTRYSKSPYNVKYWEFGNEPDVDPILVPHDSIFGCWGDEQEAYYGGGYYAEMLKKVYPAVKAIDPQSQVLNGGLLLNCDPTHPLPTYACLPSKFFEGILRNGGGQYLDIVSYHGYPNYTDGLIMDERSPKWSARGGYVVGKAQFLREVMAAYGISKPLFLTEGSLVCPGNETECLPPDDSFYEAQADFVVWMYVRAYAAGIISGIWFSFEELGWGYTGLVDGGVLKPAYLSYHFMNQEIGNTVYRREVKDYPGLLGFEFYTIGKFIWVLWSPDQSNKVIDLPGKVIQVFDKYGNILTPQAGKLTVNSPVYVEIAP
jgi:hypothetical protein